MEAQTTQLIFYVNGKKIAEPRPDPDLSLLQYLRDTLYLKGTKSACGGGACGSCTVMVSRHDHRAQSTTHRAVTACLTPLCSLHGCAVITVEGVGSIRTGLHPIQKRLVEKHGIQCGFCTPGMVMSIYALLRNNPSPTRQDIETAIEGNLCRCTGYRPILQALESFGKEFACGLGEKCCKNTKGELETTDQEHLESAENYKPYDPSQEPIFPSELQVSDQYDRSLLRYEGSLAIWLRPATLQQLFQLREAYPTSLLVAGFTRANAKFMKNGPANERRVFVSIRGVPELLVRDQDQTGVRLGAALTITEANDALLEAISKGKDTHVRGLNAVVKLFEMFASLQIRNMATLGGSLVAQNASSDVIVALLAVGASVTVASSKGQTMVVPLETWVSSGVYQPNMENGIILDVVIPFTTSDQYVFTIKQSWRRSFDRAIVNAGLSVTLEESSRKVTKARLYLGGVAKGVVMATKTACVLTDNIWEESMVDRALEVLKDELLANGIPDKQDYKCTLSLGLFYKLFLSVGQQANIGDTPEHVVSALSDCHREPVEAIQQWGPTPPDQPAHDAVGRDLPHVSSQKLSTGEAIFYTDLPKREDELFLALVRSTKGHAELLEVDTSAALALPGVVGYVDHSDVPGSNITGIGEDELIFAKDEVLCIGDVIGGIVAETEQQARRAAILVKVAYRELPVITTIEEAIKENSFFPSCKQKLSRGDVTVGEARSDHVLEGCVKIGGQDHFYLEPQVAYVVPSDTNEYDVYAATQDPSGAQGFISSSMDIPWNKLVVHHKRIGGGFGGKGHRSAMTLVLLPTFVAAHKFRRAVRCHLTREEDITTTGGRHPFLVNYKAGFTKDGTVVSLDLEYYNNGGTVIDVSGQVGTKAMHSCENVYRIPNVNVRFQSCKTNIPSNTAFRGFGQPQAVFACEYVMNEIADTLGMSPDEIRAKNFYREGETNIMNAPMEKSIQLCWDELNEMANIKEKRAEVTEFNRTNRWKKKGLAAIPVQFGVGLPLPIWQGGALVTIYLDGSVLLAHGGVEIGQGLNTKMIQIASRELGIPVDQIHIAETATSTVPNTTATVGSTATDMNGPAVRDACRKIDARLAPYKLQNPKGAFKDWVNAAHTDRISLSATGFNRLKDSEIGGLAESCVHYFTYGAAYTMVEVDCLTGAHAILQTDIVMDLGRSLNPGLDIGQIEGAFIQGRGLFTLEEIEYTPQGRMKSRGAENYKVPTLADIPMKFNVNLLKNSDNPKALYSARAVGEPPLALGMSVFFAIKDAVKSAREDNDLAAPFNMDSPATAERIRMACSDRFTKLATGTSHHAAPEWRA